MRCAIIDHLSYISETKISILPNKKKLKNLKKTINTLISPFCVICVVADVLDSSVWQMD